MIHEQSEILSRARATGINSVLRLNVLFYLGTLDDGVSVGDLGTEMNCSTPASSQSLDALERLGFIRRRRLAHDSRKVDAEITIKGRKALAEILGNTKD